ncbi:mycofactocin biosynthesis peptidyl-dipeptidase MftE [Streptomyces sp. PSKA28]|uniref:Mycofactocin biosynthesis peptidyl-dipeptidase MftE n=1 Tax=Streptomyces himalayensis subsp. himalayensis TaxID=2756131 RepID=A0A7W0DMM8_9ACTN|nr:mycofactocin biosynthesis peptidyl-dipeptidase MftE [Streptomyces himalayensis subsp. himalayensis]
MGRSVWPAVPADALVLVPVGSTEQHGPHLPLNTDSVIAQSVAQLAAERLRSGRPDRPVLLAPTIAYGASGEHAGFAGTVSIGHEALRVFLVETVRSLSLWAGRIVFVNGHGGNVPTLDAAVGQLRSEGHDVSWLGCETPGSDAHAGRAETSLMLYLAPGDVRLSEAAVGDTRPLAVVMPELMARGVRAVSPSGVLGDPTGATAEEGRAALEAMVSAAVRRIAAGRTGSRSRLVGTGDSSAPPCPSAPSIPVPPAPRKKAAHP